MRLFGTMQNIDGELSIGGIKATELAKKHGTPLYVMDQAHIEDNMQKYKENFKSDKFNAEVIYASKAFLTVAMAQLVTKNDLSMDVVSGGELYTAKHAEMDMSRIFFHGNNKTANEIKMALEFGVGTIIVDNINEAKLLDSLCNEMDQTVNTMFRVNPGIDAHTHEYIQTSHYSSKFGESIFGENVKETIKVMMNSQKINLLGFHCHIGSQIFDEKPFFKAVEVMLEFAKKMEEEVGFKSTALNLGGGFGIYYVDGDDAIDFGTVSARMIKDIEDCLDRLEMNLDRVMIEPGRSIVANAGTTLYNVGGTKTTYSGKKYIFVDGGMTDNIRPALYQAEYEGAIANRLNDEDKEEFTVAGKCCESGDVIIRDFPFTKNTQKDDILAVASTGAYGYTMSSNYNRIGRPEIIFVKDGESKTIVKRETYDDLIRNDIKL